MLSYRSCKVSSFLKILFLFNLRFPSTLSSSSLIPLSVWSNLTVDSLWCIFSFRLIGSFSSVWLFFYGLGRIQTGSSSKEKSGRHKFDSSMGAKATQEAAPCWSLLLLWDWPHLPPTLFPTHTPFPFPHHHRWIPDFRHLLEKGIESWEEMLSSLQYFPLTRSTGTGIQHGGMAVGERKHPPMCFIPSSDTCIESFHRQHQGWDNGWDLGSYWSTELSHAKAPEG